MRSAFDYRSWRERLFLPPILFTLIAIAGSVITADELPFDPAKISRLSVDDIPRSISIRQGADVWFGYDLEKAIVFKVWQSPDDKPGLIVKGFKAQSAGTAWFEETEGAKWQLETKGKLIPLSVRYLGCTQSKAYFELHWELYHPDGTIKLSERIAMAASTGKARELRELRAESIPAGASLVLPAAYQKDWIFKDSDDQPAESLIDAAWHSHSLR